MSTNYYYLASHQHKGIPYKKALNAEGWVRTGDPKVAQVALFDHITNRTHMGKFRHVVQEYADAGAAIVNYPHAAILPWWYDGLMEVPPELALLLVISEEYKRLTETFLPDVPIVSTGFPYCQILPFKSSSRMVKHILFAPIHPSRLGHLRMECYIANQNVYKELKRVQKATQCRVTVRYLYDLQEQGLRNYRNFDYIQATPDGGTREIDKADVVISEGTMLHIAVARGKAAIAMNQENPIRPNTSATGWKATHWDDYSEQIAYPINYRQGTLLQQIQQALKGTRETTEWKKKFIDTEMDSAKFALLMQQVWEIQNKLNFRNQVLR